MATEFKLNFTGSEINQKLEMVDAINNNLERNYYTSAQIDETIEEVNNGINDNYAATSALLDRRLTSKADLIGGKVPTEQLPDDLVDLGDYYTKTEIDNEIATINGNTDTKLASKADLIDGKVPASQLPDDINAAVSVADVEGLLVKDSYLDIATVWEYSDDMVADYALENVPEETMTMCLYRISDNTDPNKFIGGTAKVIDGEGESTLTITPDMFDDSSGVFVSINNEIIVVHTDFDLALLGSQGTALAGSYAARYVIEGVPVMGAIEIQAETELFTQVINPEILNIKWENIVDRPFGTIGSCVEWDGTPTDECLDLLDSLGVQFYKVGEPMTKEALVGGMATFNAEDGNVTVSITQDSFIDTSETGFLIAPEGNVVGFVSFGADVFDLAPLLGDTFTVDVPSSGLWFVFNGSEYPILLGGSDYRVKQIDPKYIPANLDFNLSDYYTKAEVDEMFGDIDEMFGDIDIILDEISTLIGE